MDIRRYQWQEAIADADLPSTTKYVGLIFSLWADSKTGRNVKPAIPTVALRAGLRKRRVQEHLATLLEAKWMLVEGARSMGGRPTTYRLNIPNRAARDPVPERTVEVEQPGPSASPTGSLRVDNRAARDPGTKEDPGLNQERPTREPSSSIPEPFRSWTPAEPWSRIHLRHLRRHIARLDDEDFDSWALRAEISAECHRLLVEKNLPPTRAVVEGALEDCANRRADAEEAAWAERKARYREALADSPLDSLLDGRVKLLEDRKPVAIRVGNPELRDLLAERITPRFGAEGAARVAEAVVGRMASDLNTLQLVAEREAEERGIEPIDDDTLTALVGDEKEAAIDR